MKVYKCDECKKELHSNFVVLEIKYNSIGDAIIHRDLCIDCCNKIIETMEKEGDTK